MMFHTSPLTYEQWLRQSGLPRLEGRLLLQACCGLSHAQLISRGGETVPAAQWADLNALAQRRRNGEPLAYLLGWREFYGRRFRVSPAVLIPRPETEHLLEAALERLPAGGRVWDLGTGSGALAVSAALERPDAAVRASDLSREALAVAQENAETLGARIEFACGSWFEAQPAAAGHFDILLSNPPYIEQGDPHLQQGDLRFEPAAALTDFGDGLAHIRTLAAGAVRHLKAGGWLMLEHGWNQGPAVRGILAENRFQDVATLPDLAGLDRITLGCLPD